MPARDRRNPQRIQRANEAEAKLANAHARKSATEAVIAHLKLQIARLRREQYGASAERNRRLLDQMELQLEDLEADAAEGDPAAEAATGKTATVTAFKRKRPARKPFPEHLPRERVVVPAPCASHTIFRTLASTAPRTTKWAHSNSISRLPSGACTPSSTSSGTNEIGSIAARSRTVRRQ